MPVGAVSAHGPPILYPTWGLPGLFLSAAHPMHTALCPNLQPCAIFFGGELQLSLCPLLRCFLLSPRFLHDW